MGAALEAVLALKRAGDAALAAGEHAAALRHYKAALEQAQAQQQAQLELELRACCAAALYPLGGAAAEAAAALVEAVLREAFQPPPQHAHEGQQAQHQRPAPPAAPATALRLAAQIALERGLWGAAAQAAAQLLATSPSDAGARALLARAVQEPAGLEQLLRDVGGAAGAAPALVLLAQAAKQHGALGPALRLLRRAVSLAPGAPGAALALAHALELLHEYPGMLGVALDFCAANAALRIGPLQLQDVLALPGLQQLRRQQLPLGGTTWHAACGWAPVPSLAERQAAAQAAAASDEPAQAAASCIEYPAVIAAWRSPGCSKQAPQAQAQLQARQQQAQGGSEAAFSAPQLHILALLLTAAKALFCGGALTAAAQLLQRVEPARRAAQPLHATAIRTEAAYAGLLLRLLWDCPPPAPSPASTAAACGSADACSSNGVVFVTGDSHVLPVAWRCITLRGRRHLLVPLLATGVKVWHLRAGSAFFTAGQFWAAVAALPRGAQLLVVLGELDCREGLHAVVAKGKFASLEEAAAATVDVYETVLARLTQQHGLRVWVHPVPPVLAATRDAVCLFNQLLARRVAELARRQQEQQHEAAGCLCYLDGLERALRAEPRWLRFDGTHLHPDYLPALEHALAAAAEA